uniref:AbiTii domain-containing protein n=1 Tax=Marinomonas sp. (strain MWYL1) TaxID=400668 RepID=A6VSV0_MARMS
MKIDQEYLLTLLSPLDDGDILTLSEYLSEVEKLGVVVCESNKRPTEMFDLHLDYIISKKLISNIEGKSDRKSLGFFPGLSGQLSIIGSVKIMKTEKEEIASNSTFNFNAPVTTQQAQFGNGNTQNVTINMQELVEKVAASNDQEAKGVLKKLLDNSTVSSVIGAGVSGLIGLL